MTILGEKIKEAIQNNVLDIKKAIWLTQNGTEVNLFETSEDDLNKYYKQSYEMLYNTDLYKPGKLELRKRIKDTMENCNAELFLRYIIYDLDIENIKTKVDVLNFIRSYSDEISANDYISCLFNNIPAIFENITINKLLDACLDKNIVNKKMIPNKFIMSQSIWLTEAEKNDLLDYDENDRQRDRREVIKERLFLPSDLKIRINPSGLSYEEFRGLIQLGSSNKISNITTGTLKVLRDKIFIALDIDLDYHIKKWTNLKEIIEKIAQERKLILKKD